LICHHPPQWSPFGSRSASHGCRPSRPGQCSFDTVDGWSETSMFLNASGFATLSHSQLEPRASGCRVWCIAAQVGEPVRVVTVVLPAEPVSNAVLVLARPRCGAAAPIRIGSARARLDGWLTRPRHEPGVGSPRLAANTQATLWEQNLCLPLNPTALSM
jgi:hypothetical protein